MAEAEAAVVGKDKLVAIGDDNLIVDSDGETANAITLSISLSSFYFSTDSQIISALCFFSSIGFQSR